MAYSKDFRRCVVKHIKGGMSWNEALELFLISRQTLSNWLKMMKQSGDLSVSPRKAYQKRKIAPHELRELVKTQPDLTLAEYAEYFHCSAQAIASRLKKLGITRKKKTPIYQERNDNRRQEYLNQLKQLDPDRRVYVDETGIEDPLHRQYAWSERGEAVISAVKGKRARRVNLIAGLLHKQLLAPCIFDGYINSDGFNYWLEHFLLKELSPGTVIIIDNARFHQSPRTKELIAAAQCQLMFLPPYSPDLNPIEPWWAIIKARIRTTIRQVRDFSQALDLVLSVN
jgi:transposase